MPHGHCYFWQPDILWSHALSDGVIAAAYFAIPLVLLYIFKKRNTTRYIWITGLFAIFITGCGLTHVMDVITIWVPLYRLDAVFRIITALASLGTAITLIKITPAMLSIPTTEEWQRTNEELKAANEKLQAVNKELAARNHFIERVTDTTPNTIYIFDLNLLKTVYHNKDAFQTIGYNTEEIYAMGAEAVKKLVHPEDIENRFDYYRHFVTASDQEIREVEFRIRHANGSYVWFLVRSTVFRRNSEGIPDQVISISQDITHIKETENNLRQALLQVQTANEEINSANEELQSLNETLIQRNHFIERVTDTIPNSIYIFDLNSSRAVYTNKELPTILDYSPEQIIALGASVMKELVHPDDYERRMQYYKDFVTARDDEVREIEFRLKHADGNYRYFLFTNAVFSRNSAGIPDQIIGMSQDITPLKQTEIELRDTLNELREANEELILTQQKLTELSIELEERVKVRTVELAESNERFELAARATNDVIWECYYGDPFIQWSPSFEQIFGYLSEEEKQSSTLEAWMARIHPEDREQTVELRKQIIRNREESWRMEYRFRRADGRYAHVLGRALILYDENKSVQRLVGSLMDISPLKEAELALQKRNEELQKINNDLDNFIYSASHDLKHPITNLEGLLIMLRNELNPPKESGSAQWLSLMDVSINRLKKTILDISEIIKVQKGLEEAYEELDFVQVLDEIKVDMTDLITQSEATIRTDFRVEQINYARKNLRSILYNLLSNALKYRSLSRPAVVELSTCLQEGHLVLTVRDNGLGLTEKQQTKLFSMFKRMHDHVEGTGIGLYMIKRIIENNGGKIVAESQQKVGSIFTVYFKVNTPL